MAFAEKILQTLCPEIPKLPPPTRGMKMKRKRRRAILPLRGERRKRGLPWKISLSDDSESNAEAIPEWRPRPKPLAES